MASHLLLLRSTHWLGQGRGWHLGEPRGDGQRGCPAAGHGLGRSGSWASTQGPIVPCRLGPQ